MKGRTERAGHLYELAESQQGYFTSAEARALGYDYPHQHFHVKQGNWIRVDHGIYRLKKFPTSEHQDLIRWWLWSRKKGVISHETATAVYEVGELLPAKVHLTVPPGFRRRPTAMVVLHKADLKESEIDRRDGFPITKPFRTIMDLARTHLDPERLSTVVKDAVQRGLVERETLLSALANMTQGFDPSTVVTLQLLGLGESSSRAQDNRPKPISVTHGGDIGKRVLVDGAHSLKVEDRKMEPRISKLLAELRSGLGAIYGKRLKGVYLYGSYARGEEDSESDVDIMVVLADFEHYAREVDRAGELTADLSLKHSVSVSPVFVHERDWLQAETPFLSNVREEAISA